MITAMTSFCFILADFWLAARAARCVSVCGAGRCRGGRGRQSGSWRGGNELYPQGNVGLIPSGWRRRCLCPQVWAVV
jgi:hypothetical protein